MKSIYKHSKIDINTYNGRKATYRTVVKDMDYPEIEFISLLQIVNALLSKYLRCGSKLTFDVPMSYLVLV